MKMNRGFRLLVIGAFAACAPLVQAEEKSVGEKSAEVWDKTKEKTKEVGSAVVKKTKETVAAVEDAIDKPDTDARTVDVKITDQGVQMPARIAAGKTAFVVTNTGKQKHNFEIEGEHLEKSFWLAIAPGASKTMQVTLKPGTYEADCKLHQPKEAKVKLTVK
jgi:iron uptake system EfeUOB component EfeO/EfeM